MDFDQERVAKRELPLSTMAESVVKHKPTTLALAETGAARQYTFFAETYKLAQTISLSCIF